MPKKTLKEGFASPALRTLTQPELSSVLGGPNAQAVGDCWRRHGDVVGVDGMGKSLIEAGPFWRVTRFSQGERRERGEEDESLSKANAVSCV